MRSVDVVEVIVELGRLLFAESRTRTRTRENLDPSLHRTARA